MVRKPVSTFNESELSKGQLRKLNALRKSVGEEIGDKAFAEWLQTQSSIDAALEDKNAKVIAEALEPLVQSKKLRIQRGGYLVKRGRGRVIVTPAASG